MIPILTDPWPVRVAGGLDFTADVRIDGGLIQGLSRPDGIQSYMGIAFADAPVGKLRWRPPRPVRAWNGVRLAHHYGSACVQPLMRRDAFMRQFGFAEPPECGMSEDCLYLNIWTSSGARDAALPVIVWLHGGGHRVGAGSHPVSRGAALAKKGVVVVTVNYRLGALGYLAHPYLTDEAGTSGNFACHDVVQALRWVRDNIAAFGGDPNCVTLFGQSAGAVLINALMGSNDSRGLFHRAILHSAGRLRGGPMGEPKPIAAAELAGSTLMQGLGARTLEDMRNLPADLMFGQRGAWSVIDDGRIVPEDFQQRFQRGTQSPVPLLCGFTRHEARAFPGGAPDSPEALTQHIRSHFGADAEDILKLYSPGNYPDPLEACYDFRRDQAYAYQPWKLAQSHLKTEAPVYLFEFDHAPPLPTGRLQESPPASGFGAYHGSELWYVFNSLDACAWNWTDDDHNLAEAMSTYWVNFARSGNPNGPFLPYWPRFGHGNDDTMLLGTRIRSGSPSNLRALQLLDHHFQRRPAK